MECNKDEALRAKILAETKFMENDIMGAHKLAIKAHCLFPTLEGLNQLKETLDVYSSFEKKINGEVDWYAILGIDPLANDETIKKNYRKLALCLHPDKNKAVGAEGAFKIVSEAWSLLSDKAKKTEYDLKRNMQKSSVPAGKNGVNSGVVNQKKTCNHQYVKIFPRAANPNTFWTACDKCRMHYEYLREHLLQTLICPSCRHCFLAVEIPIPPGPRNTSAPWSSRTQHQVPTHHAANNPSPAVGQPSSLTGQRGQPPKSCTGGSSINLKRGREAEGEGAHRMKMKDQVSSKKRWVYEHKRDSTRELSQSETQIMLMAKARTEIRKKLDEWDFDSKSDVGKFQMENADAPSVDLKKASVSSVRKGNHAQLRHSSKPSVNVVEPTEMVSMSVPDPDFHDFDQDRAEKSFGENEVWAAYDDDDGMPRLYAIVNSVISRSPFRVRIGSLNSKNNAELGPINWVRSGFRKTSGKFYIGKHKESHTLNAFSHRVKFTKGDRGAIQIYPAKGDVWALYKNWSPDWSEHTKEEVVHKYEMVRVLDDHTEEGGITVTPLVKVAGFKSVFRQQMDLKESRKIPQEEMFRFSHQVPCYVLTGQEAANVPKGCHCLELDPAALPSELLQVLTEDELVENIVKEELVETTKKGEGKGVITYSRKTVGKNPKESRGKEEAKEKKEMLSG